MPTVLSGENVMRLACGLGVLVAFGLLTPVWGDVITTANGTFGADAFVLGGTSGLNYGNSPNLVVSGTEQAKAYLRFDLSSIAAPLSSASLEFTVSANDGGGTPLNTTPQDYVFQVYGLNDGSAAGNGVLGDNWAENVINYSNAPANTSAGNAVVVGPGTTDGGQATLLGSFSVVGPVGTHTVALSGGVGSRLVNFLNADTNKRATFIVTRNVFTPVGMPAPAPTAADSAFASKESGALAPPTLFLNQPVVGPHAASINTDATWRVTATAPPAGWNTDLNFNDSNAAGWQDAFSTPDNQIWLGSNMSGPTAGQTWYRHIFTLDGPVTSAMANLAFDDDGQVYINGHLVWNDPGGGATRTQMALDPSLFHPGANLIAAHGIDVFTPYHSVDEEINLTIARGILPGDADEDGSVAFDDLLTLAQHYGLNFGATWQDGDFNGDGMVNFDDLLLLAQNYGVTLPADQLSQLGSSLVPEPAALSVLGLFVAPALIRRRQAHTLNKKCVTSPSFMT